LSLTFSQLPTHSGREPKKLMNYLIWYNTKKPHRAINKLTPLLTYMNMVIKDSFKSNMLWTLTCIFPDFSSKLKKTFN